MVLFGDMRQIRRARVRTINKAKILYWRQCLDETGEGKVWKAAIYMRPQDSRCSSCPQSRRSIGDRQPREGAGVYCSFLPIRAPAQEESLALPLAELPWQPISEIEVYRIGL